MKKMMCKRKIKHLETDKDLAEGEAKRYRRNMKKEKQCQWFHTRMWDA
jgi:hypothetical protein